MNAPLLKDFDMPSAIETLIKAYNQEVSEFDALASQCDTLNNQIGELQEQNQKLLDTVDSQSGEIGWLEVENKQLQEQVKTLQKEVADLKQSQQKENKLTKRENNQVKRLKESSAKYQTRCKTLERDMSEIDVKRRIAVKEARIMIDEVKLLQEKLAHYRVTPIYEQDGELLVSLPFPIAVSVDGGKTKEVITLLYSRNGGIFRQVSLDSHHSIGFGMLRKPTDAKYSEKSYNLANNLLDMPSEKVIQLATKWLYKVNVTQKGYMFFEDIDLTTLQGDNQ